MSHGGFSFEMERALEEDAAKLVVIGGDPGGTLDDLALDDEDGYPDCGLGANGQCSKAGSEECDFECGGLSVMAWPR